jgi:hypothetical protein
MNRALLAFVVASAGAARTERVAPLDNVHLVFSRDCRPYQDWQAKLVAHSAARVGQRGQLTQVVSGCNNETDIMNLMRSTHPRMRTHLTPQFNLEEVRAVATASGGCRALLLTQLTRVVHVSLQGMGAGKFFPFYNKPFGLNHWINNAVPAVTEQTIVVIDPDFILLKPFLQTGSADPDSRPTEEDQLIPSSDPGRKSHPVPSDQAVEGRAVAQNYPYGTSWVNFDRQYICGEGSPCTKVTHREAGEYYQVMTSASAPASACLSARLGTPATRHVTPPPSNR